MADDVSEADLYVLAGEGGFAQLVAAFYRRVRSDDILGPLYPRNDFEGAEQRLAEFLIQRFGGPATYSATRGHPRLRMRHAPFKVDVAARNRWMELMHAAMQEVHLPANVASILEKYFADTATFMINQP